ncbi:undecaprenyl-phosphate glucose phosphotransferase [Parvularcula dongshanensis]|uniref:Putative colanic acid biosynthesis UDP-glucose lipid carrier transferase n=1 Tax=Parvularcula dongshanensis TaxID=1173995 RepID=A0A840I685_9PROT|nr:undecaprenyl-phosphate glucose phosphotransferase [Parvularcula dongshanensis]MBB4659781.1 putative colanic acid biosynthesis UDP-glucose lipid carrier transferase [Parvularcula dongshanensis]
MKQSTLKPMGKASIEGSRAAMTPPRRRPVLSREMAGDIAQALTVLIVTGAAFAAVAVADYGKPINGMTAQSDPVILVCTGFLGGLALVEALRQGGYFRFDQLLETWAALRGIVWRWALTLLSLIALCYAFGIIGLLPRPWLAAWAGGTTVGLIVGRFVTASVLKRLAAEGGSLCRKVGVVGEGHAADLFIRHATERESGLSVVARFSAEGLDTPGHGTLARANAMIEAGQLDDLILCLPPQEEGRMEHLMHRLSALPCHVAMCPDPLWLERGMGQVTTIGAMPLLTLHRRPLEGWGGFVKTVEDKIIGSLIFLLALPVMIVCAIAVRLDSPGPIFFIQNRQGFAGEIFPIVKFRTMRVMENGEKVIQARKDDDRITRVGRILRRYSLDELPQLWNVLRGDMSLVGPRPHAIAHDKYYMDVIADYAGRHKVKPGITGWAQVNGFRGETSEDGSMAERVRYDLAYIENWSLWFDVRIILMTVLAVVLPRNAY